MTTEIPIIEQQRSLLELQRIDAERREAEQRMKTLPLKIAAQRDALAKVEADLASQGERLVALEKEQAECESLISEREERVRGLDEQMMRVRSQRELEAVQSEIATLRGEIGEHEDRELGLLDEIETLSAEVQTLREKAEKTRAEAGNEISRLESLLAESARALEVLAADRERFRASLPPAIASRYDALNQRHPGTGIAVLEPPNICGGCRMELVKHTMQKLEVNDALTQCEHCGRLLLPAG